jgi:hypothetical protein
MTATSSATALRRPIRNGRGRAIAVNVNVNFEGGGGALDPEVRRRCLGGC